MPRNEPSRSAKRDRRGGHPPRRLTREWLGEGRSLRFVIMCDLNITAARERPRMLTPLATELARRNKTPLCAICGHMQRSKLHSIRSPRRRAHAAAGATPVNVHSRLCYLLSRQERE